MTNYKNKKEDLGYVLKGKRWFVTKKNSDEIIDFCFNKKTIRFFHYKSDAIYRLSLLDNKNAYELQCESDWGAFLRKKDDYTEFIGRGYKSEKEARRIIEQYKKQARLA